MAARACFIGAGVDAARIPFSLHSPALWPLPFFPLLSPSFPLTLSQVWDIGAFSAAASSAGQGAGAATCLRSLRLFSPPKGERPRFRPHSPPYPCFSPHFRGRSCCALA